MMYDTLTLATDHRGVATITLNRPEKHNALSAQMIADLAAVAAAIETRDDIRVVILSGAGPSFCAGGDLGWMRDQMAAPPPERARAAQALADMLGAINRLSKPVIARLQGAVYGGGIGLACVCDKVIASQSTRFGLTETKLGLIPATIGPYVVARMGGGPAREVFMSSRSFDAATAQRLGLVSEVTSDQGIENAIETEVEAYLSCAPAAVAEAKAMALSLGRAPDEATVAASIDALLARWAHPEAEAGITAFFARTSPPWAG